MKTRDAARLTPLRMLKTALTNKSIEKSKTLDHAEELQVVNALVKQRRDSIEQFEAAGRRELAAAVEAAVASTGATSAKDMGKVMKAVMAALAGKTVDGKQVNELVRRKLG